MDTEIAMKLQEANRRSEGHNEQLKIVELQISELGRFKEVLDNFESSGEKEVLASIGKGVFVKSEMKEKDFFVDVGAGVFVKKSLENTKEVLEGQTKRLQEMKVQLNSEMERLNSEMQEIISDVQKKD
tara:strand:+ start:609 stop:992 length:384 start_codon:yes stop_codon:yes gene_type:complete